MVIGYQVEKILGVAKLSSVTGEAKTNATLNLLNLWDIADNIVGMSLDSPSTNTGSTKGACVVLKNRLRRKLLYFTCKHHVHELII